MNLLTLSTLSPGGQRDFSAAWCPDDLRMNTAEETAGGNVSDEYRSEENFRYELLLFVYCFFQELE